MSTVKDLKAKVINTLNILSGQDITETKLYKSILTASDKDKGTLIALSSVFTRTFSTFMRLLETTKIYKWLEILFDRFKVEEEVDIKGYVLIRTLVMTGLKNGVSSKEFTELAYAIKESGKTQFDSSEYGAAWTLYIYGHTPNTKKIIEIIQPMELFILTAITILTVACHKDQKPFEYYVNMDLVSIEKILYNEYNPVSEVTCEVFSTKLKDVHVENNIKSQYVILNMLANSTNPEKQKEDFNEQSLNGHFMDITFAKLINVSEKSEYEKLKTLYKK